MYTNMKKIISKNIKNTIFINIFNANACALVLKKVLVKTHTNYVCNCMYVIYVQLLLKYS